MKTLCRIAVVLLALYIPSARAAITNTTRQASSACPATFDRSQMRHRSGDYTPLDLIVTNTAATTAIGWKFTIYTMDATGDFELLGDVTTAERLKNKQSSLWMQWSVLTVDRFAGYRIVMKKISYADGTTWEGDDTMQCQITEDFRRK